MPISSLVLTLANPGERLLADLASDPRLTLGETQGAYLPVVLETSTLGESKAAVEELMTREGVRFVDIVTVDFSDGVDPLEEEK